MTIGAGYSLAQLNDALHFIVSEQPKEKTKTYRALLKHLRTLAGTQIRSMAVHSLALCAMSHSYRQSCSLFSLANITLKRSPKSMSNKSLQYERECVCMSPE